MIKRRWTWWRLLLYSLILAGANIATQIAAAVIVGVADALNRPRFDLDEWGEGLGSDGFFLSVLTIASAATSLPAIRFLTGRCEARPWEFLGLQPCPARQILLSCAAMAIFIGASDLLTVTVGRPLVPPFMSEAYTSARVPALLFVALVVVAPVFEELLFRGFLFGGLRACGAPLLVAALLVSLAFAALHVQYDAYDLTAVFLMGLLFLWARVRFNSVIPSITMHSLANTVGFIEAALVSGAP